MPALALWIVAVTWALVAREVRPRHARSATMVALGVAIGLGIWSLATWSLP